MIRDCISQLQGVKQVLKGGFYVMYAMLIVCALGFLK